MSDNCKHCGACRTCDYCHCCGKCRTCGMQKLIDFITVVPQTVPYPYTPPITIIQFPYQWEVTCDHSY